MAQTTFTPPHLLKTPVLFMVFNRLDPTKQAFEVIRQAQPPRLYVAADGPIESRDGEAEKVQAVREHVMKNIDWDCEIKTLFREKNLGCKYAVSSAITWFFKNEEMGIILEDDCLPSQSFFWFCEELLVKYKDDERIGQICGFNPLGLYKTECDYFFSKYGSIWGWASWSRAWKYYDPDMKYWPSVRDSNIFFDLIDSKKEAKWRKRIFDNVYNKNIDTWDYQWSFAKLLNSFLSINPTKNLILNIGFGKDATHTKGSFNAKFRPIFEIKLTTHPDYILRDKFYDRLFFNKWVNRKQFFKYFFSYWNKKNENINNNNS